jgi:Na+-translocating ferredoxin:NAD+ oxidoreductase RnfD subunit
MVPNALLIFIAVPGIIFAGLAAVLGIYRRKNKFLKYIPAIVSAAIALGFFIKSYFFSEGFEALGYIILMMVSAAVAGISIITAVVLEIVNRRK